MFDKKILNIYSIIIGALFIVSGLGKIANTAGFSELISNYGLGIFKYLSPVIVLFEILIGLFLVLLINPKRYSFISFCLLIVFTKNVPNNIAVLFSAKKIKNKAISRIL